MATDVSERVRQQVAERAYHVCEYCSNSLATVAFVSAKTWLKSGVIPRLKPWRG